MKHNTLGIRLLIVNFVILITVFFSSNRILASVSKGAVLAKDISPFRISFVQKGFNLESTSTQKYYWKRGDLSLSIEPSSFLSEIDFEQNLKSFTDSLWMLELEVHSELIPELKKSEDLLLLYSEKNSLSSYALVRSDFVRIADLASRIHAEGALSCGRLKKITAFPLADSSEEIFHYNPVYKEWVFLGSVKNVLEDTSADFIQQEINALSAFDNRGYNTEVGQSIPAYLENRAKDIVSSQLTIETKFPVIPGVDQTNLVIRIPGSNKDDETLIIAAHMDTILSRGGAAGDNPGSDDDASGIATMLDVLRVIAKNKLVFSRRIEFHAYGAEEIGLNGSIALARQYKNEETKVAGMLQLDMNSYAQDKNSSTIYLVTNATSPGMRSSLKNLMNTYLGGDYEELALTAGTSDHESWFEQGYPTVFPFEHPTKHNPNIHTNEDNVTNANRFDLSERFSKLVLAYLSHYAGLISSEDEYNTNLIDSPFSEDLKLAIQQSKTQTGRWDIAVSGDFPTDKVHFCKTSFEGSQVCSGVISELPLLKSSSDRKFFINETTGPFEIVSGQSYAVFAYNTKDQLIAQRSFSLIKKGSL